MLDTGCRSSYVEVMTYYHTSHPPIYYKIRTVVRCVFWGSVGAGLMAFASWFSQLDDKPACPITLNSDFTYEASQSFEVASCDPGRNVVLVDNTRWEWEI